MQEEINQLKITVAKLQEELEILRRANDTSFIGLLEDMQIERVMEADLSGTSATNTLLRDITVATVLNYPSRIMIYKWKGQRLAIPIYDASEIIYP